MVPASAILLIFFVQLNIVDGTSTIQPFDCSAAANQKPILVYGTAGSYYDVSALNLSPGGNYDLLHTVPKTVAEGTSCAGACTYGNLNGVGINPIDDIAYGFINEGNLNQAGEPWTSSSGTHGGRFFFPVRKSKIRLK